MPSIFSHFQLFKIDFLPVFTFWHLALRNAASRPSPFPCKKKKKQTQSFLTDISDPPNNHSPSPPSKLLFAGTLLRNSIRQALRARPESRVLQLSSVAVRALAISHGRRVPMEFAARGARRRLSLAQGGHDEHAAPLHK
jgi:hypothetical protein